ncbi:MAG: hypothetical protein MPN21_18700 [Thermoanaerobaculia bacterium]|nr:hypothetical protein [Thermoanaerobaculia bacterium]
MARAIDDLVCEKIKRRLSPRDGMLELIEECSQLQPSSLWEKLASLKYEADVKRLSSWLTRLLGSKPPKPRVTQLWFGLYHPWTDDNRLSSDLYVEGRAVEEQRKGLWARVTGSFYWPPGRYAGCKIVNQISRSYTKAVRREVNGVRDYELNQCYVSLFLQDFATENPGILCGDSEFRSLFTQYESSVARLGMVTKSEFQPELTWNYWNF